MDFSDLAKMKDMMGQAQQMQEQMERKLSETVVEASSGGGVVTATYIGIKMPEIFLQNQTAKRQLILRPHSPC